MRDVYAATDYSKARVRGLLLRVGVVAALLLTSACDGGHSAVSDESPTKATTSASPTPPLPSPSEGGRVVVVHKGASVVEGEGTKYLSFAVLLRNLSNMAALQATVEFQFVDESGRRLALPGWDSNSNTREVYYLHPEEVFGFGETIELSDGALPKKLNIEATVVDTQWLEAEGFGRSNIFISDVKAAQAEQGTKLAFTVDNPWRNAQDATCTFALFYDIYGRLRGGAYVEVSGNVYESGVSSASGVVATPVPKGTILKNIKMYATLHCLRSNR